MVYIVLPTLWSIIAIHPSDAHVTFVAEEEGMSLSSVPRLFFDPGFDLSRPDMFPTICPPAVVTRAQPPARATLAPAPARAAPAAAPPRRPHPDTALQEKVRTTHYAHGAPTPQLWQLNRALVASYDKPPLPFS